MVLLKAHAFLFDSKDLQALKKILEADPYADDSFAKVGFVLKESSAVGLPAGKYAVFFKCEDAMAVKLEEKVKQIPSFAKAAPEELSKLVQAVESEEDAATEGFGSIFG